MILSYRTLNKDHIEQLDLTIENPERELSRTYLVEELNKMRDKNETYKGIREFKSLFINSLEDSQRSISKALNRYLFNF